MSKKIPKFDFACTGLQKTRVLREEDSVSLGKNRTYKKGKKHFYRRGGGAVRGISGSICQGYNRGDGKFGKGMP